MKKDYFLLSYPVILAATQGDTEAVQAVLLRLTKLLICG